jgi:hypothetical protein
MFIVQATGVSIIKRFYSILKLGRNKLGCLSLERSNCQVYYLQVRPRVYPYSALIL